MKGLTEKDGKYVIDKRHKGVRLYRTFDDANAALTWLAQRIRDIDNMKHYGELPSHKLSEAVDLYLTSYCKPSLIKDHKRELAYVIKYIGDVAVTDIHDVRLDAYRRKRMEAAGPRTVNHGLQAVRRVLNLCATRFIDPVTDSPWTRDTPKIVLLHEPSVNPPRPMTYAEQALLINELPEHMANAVLFLLNTGIRVNDFRQITWRNRIRIGDTFVFEVRSKAKRKRYVVMNSLARKIVLDQFGKHQDYVFSFRGNQIKEINTTAWKKAIARLPFHVKPHDLRHTVATRLRSRGVDEQTRADILDHTTKTMTSHYSHANIRMLEDALELIKATDGHDDVILHRSRVT